MKKLYFVFILCLVAMAMQGCDKDSDAVRLAPLEKVAGNYNAVRSVFLSDGKGTMLPVKMVMHLDHYVNVVPEAGGILRMDGAVRLENFVEVENGITFLVPSQVANFRISGVEKITGIPGVHGFYATNTKTAQMWYRTPFAEYNKELVAVFESFSDKEWADFLFLIQYAGEVPPASVLVNMLSTQFNEVLFWDVMKKEE